MPLITVKAAVPSIPAGTHRATLISIAPKSMVTQYSKIGPDGKPLEQDFLEWTWDIKGETINSLTTVASGPKSRINEYLVALMGADKVQIGAGFEESDLVGKQVMAQVIVNDDGFSKIDRLMAVEAGTQTAPAAAAPVTGTDDGDLPF